MKTSPTQQFLILGDFAFTTLGLTWHKPAMIKPPRVVVGAVTGNRNAMKKWAIVTMFIAVVGLAFLPLVTRPVVGSLTFVASTNLNGTNIYIFNPTRTKPLLGNIVGWGVSSVTIIPHAGESNALPFQVSRIPQQPLGFNFGMVAIPVPGRIDRFSVRFDRAVRHGWSLNKSSGPLKGSIYFPWLRSESFFSEQLSAQVDSENPVQVFKLDSVPVEMVPSSARSRGVVNRVEPRLNNELRKLGLTLGSSVFIRIFKEPAKLELWMEKGSQYRLFRTYDICKFSGRLGPKLKVGDRQAPEGFYTVGPRQMNPNSSYHLSFNLGFPNEFDRHHRRTGSALMVHGACVSIGCYAMGDEAIEEIWTLCARALEAGQKSFQVHCFPFPLTVANLKHHEENTWIEFWKDMEPVYALFEKTRIPPTVLVLKGKYKAEARKTAMADSVSSHRTGGEKREERKGATPET